MSAAPGTGSLHPELLVSRSVRPISAASSCSACGVASHAYPCGYSQVLVSWIPAQRCVPPTQCCSSTVNTWGLPGRAQADCQGVILSEHVLGVFVATTRPPLQHWTPLALCKCTPAQAGMQARACGKGPYLYVQRCRAATRAWALYTAMRHKLAPMLPGARCCARHCTGWLATAHAMNTRMRYGPARRRLRSWSAGAALAAGILAWAARFAQAGGRGQRTLQRAHAAAELGAQRQVHGGT